jgi:hypothetical protein
MGKCNRREHDVIREVERLQCNCTELQHQLRGQREKRAYRRIRAVRKKNGEKNNENRIHAIIPTLACPTLAID